MEMRRAKRQVKDLAAIQEIVNSCKICRLAMEDQEGLYIVPMSPGARWDGEKLTLYFHCAGEGRKISALRADPRCAFEMDREWRLTGEGDKACTYSCDYQCVTGRGTVRFVEDSREKAAAMAVIMTHQTGRAFTITEEMTRDITILALEAETYTAKAHITTEPLE